MLGLAWLQSLCGYIWQSQGLAADMFLVWQYQSRQGMMNTSARATGDVRKVWLPCDSNVAAALPRAIFLAALNGAVGKAILLPAVNPEQ